MSTNSTSTPRSLAARTASKTRPAASAPASRAITSAPGALAPDLELIDGGGAKGVAGRQHHLAAFGAEFRRELADGRGLAGAVDADNQDHERLVRRIDRERLRDGLEHLLDLGGNHRIHFRGRNRLVVAAFGQRIADAIRGIEAEIGAHQHVLDLGDRLGVELALGDEVGDRAAQRRRRALEPAREAPPKAALCFVRSFTHIDAAAASVAPVIAVSVK